MILELHVTTTTGCPDPIEVVAMAQGKAPADWNIVMASADADARASIDLAPPRDGAAAHGHLDGTFGARDLDGSTCATVAEALAFSLALRLPRHVDAPTPPADTPPRPTRRPDPPRASPVVPLEDPAHPHALVEMGMETQFAWGLAPSPWAGGVLAGVHLRGMGLFTPGLRTTLLHGFPGRPDPEANAVFERWAVRLDTCPIGADTSRLHVAGCVGVGIEALALATGESTAVEVITRDEVTDRPATFRVNVLAAARIDVRVADPFRLELTAGLVLNPGVEGFAFDEHGQSFESAGLAPFLAIAPTVSIE